jgi:methylmalonyl-CoA/ethylmalonyl-CoA epimerase
VTHLVIVDRPIFHVGYVVQDIASAIEYWSQTFGAGPFFVLGRFEFDEVRALGQSAVFDHAVAFGQCGSIAVEFQQIAACEPAEAATKLVRDRASLNHVAFMSPDPAADSDRLERAGMPQFMYARRGPMELRFHDAPALGHAIEIHQESDQMKAFFAELARVSKDWDGEEALRMGPPPGLLTSPPAAAVKERT